MCSPDSICNPSYHQLLQMILETDAGLVEGAATPPKIWSALFKHNIQLSVLRNGFQDYIFVIRHFIRQYERRVAASLERLLQKVAESGDIGSTDIGHNCTMR